MADELKTVLGFEAADAISSISKLTTALEQYATAVKNAAATTGAFNKTSSGIASVTKAATQLDPVVKKTQDTFGTLSTKLASSHPVMLAQAKAMEAVGDAAKKTNTVLISWRSLVGITQIQVLHQALSALKSAFTDAATESRKFINSVAEIQTIAADAFGDIENLATKIQEFSAASGQPLEAVTSGLYQTLSNQVVDAADSFKFLGVASDLSIGAVMDLGSAVNLLSSVINSYGMNASDAADVSGKLFKAIELGRFKGQELGDTFGRVTGLSSQLGVSFEEVLASMASLTRAGMKYDEAFTLITNTELKLIKPTKELSKRFKEMGVTSGEAGVQAYGFRGLLEEIAKGSGETASELAKMFNQIRAIRGVLGLTGTQAEFYAEALDKITKASIETAAAAKKIVFETDAKQVELELNRLNIAMVNFGRGVTSVTLDVFDAFGGATQTIRALTVAVSAGAATWLLYRFNAAAALAATNKQMLFSFASVSKLKKAWDTLKTSPVAWALAVTAAVLIVQYALNKAIKAAQKARKDMDAALTGKFAAELINYEAELKVQETAGKKYLAAAQKILFERQRLFEESGYKIAFVENTILSGLSNQLGDHLSAAESLFGSFMDKAKNAAQEIKNLQKESADIATNLADWKFDRSIKGLSDAEQSTKQLKRAQDLANQANEAARRGEFELAKATQDRANSQAKAAVASADQSNDIVKIKKAEKEAETIMRNQIGLNDQQIAKTKETVKQIKNLTPMMRQFTGAMKEAVTVYSNLEKKLKETSDPIDREKIIGKMKSLAKEIESEFASIKKFEPLADTDELKRDLVESTKEFYSVITGEISTFNQSIGEVESKLKNLRATIRDVTAEQQIGVQLGKNLEEGTKALDAQKQAQDEINKSVALTQDDYDIYLRSLSQASVIQSKARTAEQVAEEASQVRVLAQQLTDAATKANNLALAGKAGTEEYAEQIKRIQQIRKISAQEFPGGFLGQGTIDAGTEALDEMINRYIEIGNKQKEITEGAEKADIAKALTTRLKGAADPVAEALKIIEEAARQSGQTVGDSITAGITTATTNVTKNVDAQVIQFNKGRDAALEYARAVASIGTGSGGKAKAMGGMIYKAGGGFAKGTDTIPAMLSPGEFVVNAESSRRFFSQLVAMNSGRQPIYRKDGGPTTVGDINININESKMSPITARDLANTIRREIKRKTIHHFN